jgi:hypothetical protein
VDKRPDSLNFVHIRSFLVNPDYKEDWMEVKRQFWLYWSPYPWDKSLRVLNGMSVLVAKLLGQQGFFYFHAVNQPQAAQNQPQQAARRKQEDADCKGCSHASLLFSRQMSLGIKSRFSKVTSGRLMP